jgi:hypothetical protein
VIITAPGIYKIDSATYHADPCPKPSLSSSIAFKLISESPLHAKYAHPRLTVDLVREESTRMDIGSICHALMLEGENIAVVIDEPNYRKAKAQEARDEARLAGKCPILAHEMIEVKIMMETCLLQLATQADKHVRDAFVKGKGEQTLVWQEANGIWCRCRPDWLHSTMPIIYDYKTSGRSAHPQNISRIAAGNGWLIQDAFYRRGLGAVMNALSYDDIDADFYFICQETSRPYALTVFEVSPHDRALAEAQVDYAINTFGECLRTGVWPGYSNKIERITSPAYVEQAWLEREQ